MRKYSKGFLLLLMVLLPMATMCHAQGWDWSITKADEAMNREPKPMLILLSTQWCKFCSLQKSQLRKNKDFVQKADRFYFVEFDAETTETLRFRGLDYHFRANGAMTGIHELAEALNGSQRIAFPTWVLLDRNYRVLFRYSGVLPPTELDALLQAIETMEPLFLQKPVNLPVE